MNKEMVMGVIRHVLTALGGVLAQRGVVTAGEVETLVGALLIVVGLVWSVAQKRAGGPGSGVLPVLLALLVVGPLVVGMSGCMTPKKAGELAQSMQLQGGVISVTTPVWSVLIQADTLDTKTEAKDWVDGKLVEKAPPKEGEDR